MVNICCCRTRWLVGALLAANCLSVGPVTAGTGQSASGTVRGPVGNQIHDYLTNLSQFGYSGVMLVVKNGEVVLRHGYGLANEERRIPNTPETVFDIGSLSKQFTAAAILTLEQQGKLKVTDRMAQYLPGTPEDKRDITLEQLLTHSSGMDRDFPLADPNGAYYEDVTRDDAVRRILALPLTAAPGQEFAYSNIGYVLLAAVVEHVSQEPFRDFLQRHLFEPVGMVHTGFWGNRLPHGDASLIARCYDETGETGDPSHWSDSTWVDLGAGEIVSTIDDLHRWQTALATHRILPAAAVKRMFTPHRGDYGYGWFIQKTPRGTSVIQHGGDYFGFGSQISWFKDEDVLLIHLANRSSQVFGTRHVAERIATQMIFGATAFEMFKGKPFELPPACGPVTRGAVQRYAGTYALASGGRLVIYPERDGLQIGAIGQDAVDAIAAAPDSALQRRARLNSVTTRMMNGMAAGDTTAFTARILRPGGPLHGYRQAIMQTLEEARESHGALKSIIVDGTMPGIYPPGVMHTKVRLECERGSDSFDFVWLNDRIIGMTPAPDYLAATPLKQGTGDSLVGWSIIWFAGFDVSPANSPASRNAHTLQVRHKNRTFEAQRLSG